MAPPPHTAAELSALIGLLTGFPAMQPAGLPTRPGDELVTVAVGHGRDDALRAAAAAFAEEWRARGGRVLATVDWPESAASWLRPARRLTAQGPRAWVVTGAVTGWAQMSRRLRHSTAWDPARTFAFAALHDPRLRELAGPDAVRGLRGATAEGGTWEFGEEAGEHEGEGEGFFRPSVSSSRGRRGAP
ncbi:hypothetical protein [Streptomyces sp. NPDC059411]|uniref:hypothetical protein n=1 Tax=Streptomyces sp. NPDC059411 TaxID=3346825 RepID=UPI0036C658EC